MVSIECRSLTRKLESWYGVIWYLPLNNGIEVRTGDAAL